MPESVESTARSLVAGIDARVFTNARGSSDQQTQRAESMLAMLLHVEKNMACKQACKAMAPVRDHRRTNSAEERLSMLTGASIREDNRRVRVQQSPESSGNAWE